jgi:spermidine/putrescine transport system substrate-binding protein
MADKTKAPDFKGWGDLCDPKLQGQDLHAPEAHDPARHGVRHGRRSVRAYADLEKYQGILDKVADKLIECKANIKAYWKGGDDLGDDAVWRNRCIGNLGFNRLQAV